MKVEKIEDIRVLVKQSTSKKRLVIADANDMHSLEAAYESVKAGIVDAILVGDEAIIKSNIKTAGYDPACFTIIHQPEERSAVATAVELVRERKAEVLMKGLVSTDKYMKAILNKEHGLLEPNAILSHVVVEDCPGYHKLLVASDLAVIPAPDLTQKMAMVRYVASVAHLLGIEQPKIAVIAPTEQVLPKIQSTVDAAILAKMSERGQLAPNAIVDGPMALDVALDKESAEIKKVMSPVAGDADGLIFPSLEAGNVFYKMNTKICRSQQAAVLVGTRTPCVLSSRGDSVETKVNSIALAALMSEA